MTQPNEESGLVLRLILDKLDTIDKKVDGQAEKLVSHEYRLAAMEKAQDSKSGLKDKVYVAIVGAIAAGAVAVPVSLIPHH